MQEAYDAAVGAGEIAPDPAQIAALPAFDRLLEHLDRPRPRGLRGLFARSERAPGGLYLWGGVGRGKSMLMEMFLRLVEAPARRVHFHVFMQEIHAGMKEARQRGEDDALRPVAGAIAARLRLLALDEMEITDIADAMIVGRLFEALLGAGVVIVTTSNRPPDDLYKDGLNRQLFLPFIALLKERMEVHHLASETDHRQERLAGEQVYFTPNDARARARIEALWQDLGGGECAPLVLKVHGRDVELPRYCDGVARAAFWELCARPLGAADYLAIANAVRVLILEDVPRLSRSNFNEARRFVVLIDALYEAKVRLIMSAADVPENLYVEGEGAFEFERTASRLREMQSAGWAEN